MVSRVFFGSLLLFLFVSFVPPGVGKEIVKLPVAVNGDVPVLVRSGVTDVVQNLAETFATPENKAKAKVLAQKTGKRGVTFLSSLLGFTGERSDAWRAAAATATPEAQELFVVINAAAEDEDLRSCYALPEHDHVATDPTHGDWLAYCLARVTGDNRRCEQITEHTVPALKTLCHEELP